MIPVTQNTSARIQFRLRSAADGTLLTGIAYSAVTATVRKADGTNASLTVGPTDWEELSSGAFANSGTYELLLPSSATSVVGGLTIALAATGAAETSVDWLWVRASTEADVKAVADAIKAKTDNLPSDPADESLLEAAVTAATSGLATGADVLAVKAKTDNLPSDPADQSLVEAAIAAAQAALEAAIAGVSVDLTPVLDAVDDVDTKLGTPVTTIAGDIANISGGGSSPVLVAGRSIVTYSVLEGGPRRVPALVEAIGENNILSLFVFDPIVGSYHLRKVPYDLGGAEGTWNFSLSP